MFFMHTIINYFLLVMNFSFVARFDRYILEFIFYFLFLPFIVLFVHCFSCSLSLYVFAYAFVICRLNDYLLTYLLTSSSSRPATMANRT